MKILWVTINRENRVATIFDPLREEVQKIADVDVIMKKLPLIAGQYQQAVLNGRIKDKPLINIKKANEYDYIMLDAPFAFMNENWSRITTKKAALFEDQHGSNPIYSKRLKGMGFTTFFTRYKNLIGRHSHLNNVRICWLPHSIDTKIYHDYNQKKKIPALMIGRIHKGVYPLRNRIHNVLKRESKQFYRRIGRPDESFEIKKKWPVGKDYARLINSANIAFTCASTYKYPVLKFFEIPGCKTALFSNHSKELAKLGFIPDKNMVEIKMNFNVKFIMNWLNDKNRLEEITEQGFELVHTKHTAKKRAEEFLNYLEG